MESSPVLRWTFIALAVVLAVKFGPSMFGSEHKEQLVLTERYVDAPGFTADAVDDPPGQPAEGELCTIRGLRYEAELSTRGAAITHFRLTDDKYTHSPAADLSSTVVNERWRSLRTLFRGSEGMTQLPYDRFPWALTAHDDASCTFTHEAPEARIVKRVSAGTRPYELAVETTVENRAPDARAHRFAIATYAYRKNGDVKGSFGRVSPFSTDLSVAVGPEVTRKPKTDFKKGWFEKEAIDRYVAVTNYYFAQALVPAHEGVLPQGELLAEQWYAAGQDPESDEAGTVFHANLEYPARTLQPGEKATYRQEAYFGPKERDVLAGALAGRGGLSDLIDLGTFSGVAKLLVGALRFFAEHVTGGSWGLAVVCLTLTIRTLLLPLLIPGIQTTVGMRKIKPEVDALNEKFKDDPMAKSMATQELWRKHKINPAKGCLPQLAAMPVWFAMYTTLQTAVEMYNTHFLWFQDLSAPDPFYVLPLLLGGFMIVQQKLVPAQGMDPVQQQMMTWMMPAIFTLMMLFLPAALGLYMLTNSVLGIVQQLAVERIARREVAASQIVVSEPTPAAPRPSARA
jgi:YidC/Oxa1 family membrane protein insertase